MLPCPSLALLPFYISCVIMERALSSELICVAGRPLALFSTDATPSNIIPLCPRSPLALKKDLGSLKCMDIYLEWLVSHSRYIQCLVLRKALKCKTDGGANQDQREQTRLSGLLSSHARRCCHSESQPRSVHSHDSQHTPSSS